MDVTVVASKFMISFYILFGFEGFYLIFSYVFTIGCVGVSLNAVFDIHSWKEYQYYAIV
jgi:hypothetical protein